MKRKKGAYITEERARAEVCKGSGLGKPAEQQENGSWTGSGVKGRLLPSEDVSPEP